MQLKENKTFKIAQSENYNYIFRKDTGYFLRWGSTEKDDPEYSEYGPEILDIEITTKCNGIPQDDGHSKVCAFCYKANTPDGKNMSFETFKTILTKFPRTLTQIAFGGDSEASSNPDLWKMSEYCRSTGIIPNITVAHISDEVADNLAKYMGAVAVSKYPNKDICYNAVKKLTDRKMSQINIHYMLSEQTYEEAFRTIDDIVSDERLSKLNAVVFLQYKPKGRNVGKFSSVLNPTKYKKLINYADSKGINYGFDSCSALLYLKSIKDSKNFETIQRYAEPCESGLFSAYCNVEGEYTPCSFADGEVGWERGINMLDINDFMQDVWNSNRLITWRKNLLTRKRDCPLFNLTAAEE